MLIAVAVRAGGIMEDEGMKAIREGKSVWAVRPPSRAGEFRGGWNLLGAGAKELVLPNLNAFHAKADTGQAGGGKRTGSDIELVCLGETNGLWERRPIPESYLWHFTRSCPGPWPGQSMDEYFCSLIQNSADAGHFALDALIRILTERTIRASSKIIRGKYPVVCFTNEHPETLVSNRRFRPALARWDFEPYAIGVLKDEAEKAGAKPVRYLASAEFRRLNSVDRPYFQKSDEGSIDWRHEREWRTAGDFDLTHIDPAGIRVVILTGEETPFRTRMRG